MGRRHRARSWVRDKHNYEIYYMKKFSMKITYNKMKLDVNLGTAHRDGAGVQSSCLLTMEPVDF